MLQWLNHYYLRFKIVLAEDLPLRPKKYNGPVYAIGGGSVIDKAKLMAYPKACYVIPTNASGAAMTSHAVIWEKDKKIDIKTPIPILLEDEIFPISLSKKNIIRTVNDCYCHIVESFNSKNATDISRMYCRNALKKLLKFFITRDINTLIDAGNYAGRAIEITGTNFIHAMSYVLTLEHGLCHGDALKEAMNIDKRNDAEDIIWKAQKYRKFWESTVIPK